MLKGYASALLLWAHIALISGCTEKPLPPEVLKTTVQEQDLWREGASVYAPDQYKAYINGLNAARMNLAKERGKFVWFRDYDTSAQEFSILLTQGEELRGMVMRERKNKAGRARNELASISERTRMLKELASTLYSERTPRNHLTRAEVALREAASGIEHEDYDTALRALENASEQTEHSLEALMPVIRRYTDKTQLAMWNTWAKETVGESLRKESYAVVISKIDRRLILYRSGKPVKGYPIGIGINGIRDKLHAGDKATPEGRYRIIRKNPNSKFHKALVLDYPNSDDRRAFNKARREGRIPSGVGIGGLIEIHGGGTVGMTYGCIALDNSDMDEIYSLVGNGTPVTVVGVRDESNIISESMERLRQ